MDISKKEDVYKAAEVICRDIGDVSKTHQKQNKKKRTFVFI